MPYRSIFRPGLFAGQSIIVTGGGSGFGRCTAHELAHLGAHVVLLGRRIEKLQAVAAELEADNGHGCASYWTADIRDEERVKQVVGEIAAARGRIDGLVNNAGGQFPAALEKISAKGWDAVVRNNLTGGFLMARECFLQSMERRGGAIVNMLADFRHSMPTMGHSGAARAGMENFTRTAALEWARCGVRVNAVAPGWVASSGFDTYDEETKSRIASNAPRVPLKRFGVEAEVSAPIVFLLSPAAAFITGVTIEIDGGVPLVRPDFPMPDHDRSKPYDGFHRYTLPKVLQR
jgi:citronellol/citronellal dehydrogenase